MCLRCRHAWQQADWSIIADTSKNCYNFSIHLKFCDLEEYFVTKVLLNFDRFYSILATIQYFRLWKSAIMDHFVTFRERVYMCHANAFLNSLCVCCSTKHLRCFICPFFISSESHNRLLRTFFVFKLPISRYFSKALEMLCYIFFKFSATAISM